MRKHPNEISSMCWTTATTPTSATTSDHQYERTSANDTTSDGNLIDGGIIGSKLDKSSEDGSDQNMRRQRKRIKLLPCTNSENEQPIKIEHHSLDVYDHYGQMIAAKLRKLDPFKADLAMMKMNDALFQITHDAKFIMSPGHLDESLIHVITPTQNAENANNVV